MAHLDFTKELSVTKFDKEKVQIRIAQSRIAKQYTYRGLSSVTGISPTSLYRMETDFSPSTPLLHLIALSKILHVPFTWLCGMED